MELKDGDALQIGKIADMLDITTRTIRYYEEIGLMPAPRRLDGGVRVYDKEDVTRLKFILKLKNLGLSLKEMQDLAEIYAAEQNADKIMPRLIEILDMHIRNIDEKISALSSLRTDITDYRARITDILKNQTNR